MGTKLSRLGLASFLAVLPAYSQTAERALVQKYCAGCHNRERKSAGIDLATSDLTRLSDDPQMWEKVIRKVRAGAMPPLGMPRPNRQALDGFASYLEHTIDAGALKADPGPAVLHRMNRAEYGTAIRDLLDLDVDVASFLPPDDANQGFDNSAGSLSVSPALLEGYLGPVNTMPFSHEMYSSERPIGYSTALAAVRRARMPANWAAAKLSRGFGDPPYYLRPTYN